MKGDLVFVRSQSLLGMAIEEFDGYFSHCAVLLTESTILESKGLMRSRIVPFYFDDMEYEIVSIDLTDDQRNKVYEVAINLTGFSYDYWKIAGIALSEILNFKNPHFLDSPNEYICSELAGKFLEQIGWADESEGLSLCSVNKLYEKVKNKLSEE